MSKRSSKNSSKKKSAGEKKTKTGEKAIRLRTRNCPTCAAKVDLPPPAILSAPCDSCGQKLEIEMIVKLENEK